MNKMLFCFFDVILSLIENNYIFDLMCWFFAIDVCVYKGVIYNQGNTWTDGCDYSCECIDADNGLYKCTDR